MQNWILTDGDSFQHVHKRGGTTFDVVDICAKGDGRYAALLGQIALNAHDLNSPAFIYEYLKPYGYSSMAELRTLYGAAASQIAAECIFETKPFSFGEAICEGTFDECSAYISTLVLEDGK